MKLAILLLVLVLSAICEEQQDRTQCPPRVRRSWRSLSAQDKQLTVDAFDALKRSGEWDQFADMHNDQTNRDYAHGKPGFFVWHRHYLFGFENAIRALGGRFACFCLPYWPFEMDAGRETNSAVFDYFGYPNEVNGQCVTKAPFNNWRAFDGPCIRRTYQQGFSFVGEARVLELIVNTQNYGLAQGFRSLIEGSPHAGVHNYLGGGGGHMGTMASPNDPLFFLLHCNVDRLFTIWYDCRDYENGRFTSGAWPDANGRQPMPFLYRGQTHRRFPRQVSPIDAYNLNTQLHPYRYDENDRMVGLIESTAGSAARCRFNLFNGETSKKRVLQELEEDQQNNYRPVLPNIQPNQTVKFWHEAVQNAYDTICTHEIPDAPKMYQIHATAMAECNICTGGGRRIHASDDWIRMSHMENERAVFDPICGRHNQQQQQYQDQGQQQYQDQGQQQYQDQGQQQYQDQGRQYAPIQVGQYQA